MPEVKFDTGSKDQVPPIGPKDANIVIVGEAPGADEVRKKKPFVGTSGRLLNQMLDKVGIKRHRCYLTNVVKRRPPRNNFKVFYDKNQPTQELRGARERLRREIEEVNPNVIICLGAEATKAVLGRDDIKISDWRGSVIDTSLGKVVPTYHPAYILRMYKLNPIMLFDLKKARNESLSPEYSKKERKILIEPSKAEVMAFLEECKEAEYLSFDIETLKLPNDEWFIDCIGLAFAEDYGMSIPLTYGDGESCWSLQDEIEVLRALADVLGDSSIKKIAQNAQYDIIFLERLGVPVNNLWFDTMNASKVMYPEYSKSLAFLVSIYTDEPYYKDTSTEERWIYNGKDATCTYEVAFGLIEDMKETDVYDFYRNHVHPLVKIYIDIQQFGVKLDLDKRSEVEENVTEEIQAKKQRLRELTGRDINVYSVKDMRSYIYGELQMKERRNKRGNLDTSKETLNEFYRKTGREEFKLMMELRQVRSRKSTYIGAEYGDDGRMRCTYDVSGTETGRLSSKKTPLGKGMNLQNVTKNYRTLFVPDDGYVFLGADLSQAENRVVAYLCEDENMMKVVDSEGDIHTNNAALIFDKPKDAVTYKERQLGKRITHGCLLPEAEVLTRKGWIQFKDLEEDVEVAQFDPETKEIEFVIPEICKFEHDGKMYKAEGNRHKNVYTPGHRIPYVSKRDYLEGCERIRFKFAEEIVNMGQRPGKLPVSGRKKDGDLLLDDDFIRLLVMIQADMSLEKTGSIRGSFRKARKKIRAIEILESTGIPYSIQKSQKEGYLRLYIDVENSKRLTSYFKDNKVFGDWVYELPYHSLRVFVDEVQYWDGHTNSTNWLYDTTVKENAVIVQTAAHLCGHSASLNCYDNNTQEDSYGNEDTCKKLYRVVIAGGKNYVGLRKEHWSSYNYKGAVYSLRVPKTSYLTRYDDCIMVTGNTNYCMGPITFAKYAKVPTSEARQLQEKYHNTYPKLKYWHKEIEKKVRRTRELVNPFGRKRRFNDRMGDSLFREAVAYIPQSTVADAIHRATIEIYARLPHPARVIMNLHDAMFLQVPDNTEWIELGSKILKEALEKPFTIEGKTLSIPTEVKVGYNWKEVS